MSKKQKNQELNNQETVLATDNKTVITAPIETLIVTDNETVQERLYKAYGLSKDNTHN